MSTKEQSPEGLDPPGTVVETKVSLSCLSGREDLNLRLLGPEPSALPGCATPRVPLARAIDVGAHHARTARVCQVPMTGDFIRGDNALGGLTSAEDGATAEKS